jgi:hypothetical protein
MTQVVSGELKAGDEVIVGDGTQVDTNTNVNRGNQQGQRRGF